MILSIRERQVNDRFIFEIQAKTRIRYPMVIRFLK